MAVLTGRPQLSTVDLYTSELVKTTALGTLMDSQTGKYFRYCLNGAAALVKGNLLQEAANDVQFDALAVQTAGVIGDQYLTLTNGTTTITPFMFDDGTVFSNTAGAAVTVGDEYTIKSITGTLTSGGTIKVWTDRPLRYAYATSATKVGLNKSPFGGVIQFPITTQTGMPVGGAIYEIPASTATVPVYGWIQTHGVFAGLSDNSTFAIGSGLVPSLAAAGAFGVNVAGTTHTPVGVARHAAETTKCIPIFLNID